jgi:hypothetical protein
MEPAPKADKSLSDALPIRYSGWALLLGLLGVCLLLIGFVLGAMLQAPVVPPHTVLISIALIGSGIILLVIAWLGRSRQT